ncbi:MAG: hypothetical protein ACREA0_33055, partial [bacterium]
PGGWSPDGARPVRDAMRRVSSAALVIVVSAFVVPCRLPARRPSRIRLDEDRALGGFVQGWADLVVGVAQASGGITGYLCRAPPLAVTERPVRWRPKLGDASLVA